VKWLVHVQNDDGRLGPDEGEADADVSDLPGTPGPVAGRQGHHRRARTVSNLRSAKRWVGGA
jgi:hypothetical protein